MLSHLTQNCRYKDAATAHHEQDMVNGELSDLRSLQVSKVRQRRSRAIADHCWALLRLPTAPLGRLMRDAHLGSNKRRLSLRMSQNRATSPRYRAVPLHLGVNGLKNAHGRN